MFWDGNGVKSHTLSVNDNDEVILKWSKDKGELFVNGISASSFAIIDIKPTMFDVDYWDGQCNPRTSPSYLRNAVIMIPSCEPPQISIESVPPQSSQPFKSCNQVQLTCRGADYFEWPQNPLISCQDCPNPIISVVPNQIRPYKVRAYNIGCNSKYTEEMVYIEGIPTVIITTNNYSVCKGNSCSANVTANSANVGYSWVADDGNESTYLSCTDCANPTIMVDETHTFTVTGTAPDGCSDSKTVTVTVHEPFVANCLPASTTYCKNNTQGVSIVCNKSDNPGVQYSWTPATGLNYTNTNQVVAKPQSTTNYVFTVSDGVCPTVQQTVIVNVSQLPVATFSNTTPGLSVTFTADQGGANTTYDWKIDGVLNTNHTQSFTNTFASSGTYSVQLTVTNECGSTTITKTILVKPIMAPCCR